MPIVTLSDMKAKPAAKPGKKTALTALDGGERLSLSEGTERAGNRKRKACKRGGDEDGDYHDEHEEIDKADIDECEVLKKKKRHKHWSSEKSGAEGARDDTLTSSQTVVLHWARLDTGPAAVKSKHAAVGKEQTEEVRGSQSAGANKPDVGEVKISADSAGSVRGKLRNGKKRDIGRRLGDS